MRPSNSARIQRLQRRLYVKAKGKDTRSPSEGPGISATESGCGLPAGVGQHALM